jgi:membrane associated rhomboid family serine protease
MLLPLHDRNPVVHIHFQIVTCLIIAACVLVFLWELTLPDTEEANLAFYRLAFVPARLFGLADGTVQPDVGAGLFSMITSMFLHAGFWHLLGNMWFLWIYGDNIEDATGHMRFIFFYLICGAVAALAQALVNIHDATPMIGASGAISGVLGGYLVLHPRVRILVMTFFFITFRMRAIWLIGFWIAYQVVLGLIEDDGGSGVAWWAHIGGFAAGALLITLFRRPGVPLFDREDFEPEDESATENRAQHLEGGWGPLPLAALRGCATMGVTESMERNDGHC